MDAADLTDVTVEKEAKSSETKITTYENVINFWFNEIDPSQWWKKNPEFDALIEKNYLSVIHAAAKGELYLWRSTPKGRLAEIIVLDQFSRNVFRDTPQAFSQDNVAIVLAQAAVAAGAMKELQPKENTFLLMPYMHSESKIIHEQGEQLYQRYAPHDNYEFELKHKSIIDRFGRYPHRNEILGRQSTPEELQFLQEPGSSF